MSIRFTIGRKISLGYVLILLIMLVCGFFIMGSLRRIKAIDRRLESEVQPALVLLNDFHELVVANEGLVKDWIYQPSESGREALRTLVDQDQNKMKDTLHAFNLAWKSFDANTYAAMWADFDRMQLATNRVMQTLEDASAYDSAELIDNAITVYEQDVIDEAGLIMHNIKRLRDAQEVAQRELISAKSAAFSRAQTVIVVCVLLSLLSGAGLAWFTTRQIVRPVFRLQRAITQLSQGKLPELVGSRVRDEVGDMVQAMVALIQTLRLTSEFANQIGKGNLEAQFIPLGDDDVLGNSLVLMRDSLRNSAREEARRTWIAKGLARFGEIIRDQDQGLEPFCDAVMLYVANYAQANQGRLYLVREEPLREPYLRLASCYAWNKKKFIDQEIRAGEGLAGQCWFEGEAIYMTQVPENYVRITSGLGDANPTAILIVPLKARDLTVGILELAFFRPPESHVKEWVMQMAENLAAAIASMQMNERTRTLLDEARLRSQSMQAQEEEMRQSVEELSAVQEEMMRQEKAYLNKIQELQKP